MLLLAFFFISSGRESVFIGDAQTLLYSLYPHYSMIGQGLLSRSICPAKFEHLKN